MSKTNIGCPTCGVIGLHFHSWQADFGTLPQVTALRHDVGGGDHIHIQVVPRLLVRSKWLRPPSMRG